MQSRRESLVEALVGTLVAYVVGVLTNLVLFEVYDLPLGLRHANEITIIFTALSLLRGYIVRRVFNAKRERAT